MEVNAQLPSILISCYYHKTVKGENVIRRHAFAYQLSGSLTVWDGRQSVTFTAGDFRFNVRNKLAKFAKEPGLGEPFRSLSLQFDEEVLREFAAEHQLNSEGKPKTPPSFKLKKHPLLQNFMDALQQSLPYFEAGNRELVKLKLKEALVILLKVQPELKDLLFDFDPPGKINLKAFMEQNFRYNLSIVRLAYLSGRSISGFKRDFYDTYQTTPAKWVQAKRLDEAYYLLREKQMRPSDVCAEVGFENRSHFSFIFKRHFGRTPAEVLGQGRTVVD